MGNAREVCEPQGNKKLTVVAPNMLDALNSDPTKLSSLVQELIEALDHGERSWRYIPCSAKAMATNQEAA